MAKALTKEDLIYILNSIFRLSSEPNNSFKMLDDGLFVEDYHQDLKTLYPHKKTTLLLHNPNPKQ